jgi:soluble lytic murein transglycosylase-like protein
LIPDQADDVIVASLDVRQATVAAGETATFRLALLNNGACHACFEVRVEGWLDEQWVSITLADAMLAGGDCSSVWLRPLERTTLCLALTPPRSATALAGDHALAVVVCAPQYPQRVHRLGARLTIQAYTELTLGTPQPSQVTTSWQRRSGRLCLPVTNRSNQEAMVYVHGHDANRRYDLAFQTPDQPLSRASHLTLKLAAGATANILLRATVRRRLLIRLRKQTTLLCLAAGVVNSHTPPQTVNASLITTPLFGARHLFALLVICLLGLVGSVVVAATTAMLALRPAAEPPVTNQIATSPPVVAIVVSLAQPASMDTMPVLASDTPGTANPETHTPANLPTALSQPDPAFPIVQLEQVSAPGVTNHQPPATSHQPSTGMSYQQMFQEIAMRYDLNWRMLAAQAYIESSFDTLALGNGGALGLMQIMPETWREWAPVVDVADPFDAYSSVLVAAAYLDYLRSELGTQGHPQQEWMLVAYNWGPDKLNDHLAAGLGWDDLPTELRQYATDILRIAESIPVN